jgi:HEAT repeats
MNKLILSAAVVAVFGGTLEAQSIASRVGGVRSGTVRMSYPAAAGVCGNGRGNISVRRGDGTSTYSAGNVRAKEWEDQCESGPVRVALDVDGGRVTDVRAYVGGRWRGEADLDLGTVGAQEASDYLLDLAGRADAKPAKEAIFPAMIAEGVTVWPQLLSLAKDSDRPRDVRNSAIFWVSQAAGEAATKGLQEVVADTRGDREVRKSAVFSLSQRPKDESVPALINIARTNKDPELRRSAIFWLGQSKDPRAVKYFEEILLAAK